MKKGEIESYMIWIVVLLVIALLILMAAFNFVEKFKK